MKIETQELVPFTDPFDGFKYWPTTQEFSHGAFLIEPVGGLPGIVVEIYFSDHRNGSDYREGRHHIIVEKGRLFSALENLYAGRLGFRFYRDDPKRSELVTLGKKPRSKKKGRTRR